MSSSRQQVSFNNELVRTVAAFLCSIGIEVIPCRFDGETFLPGIEVDRGRLLVDESHLTYPLDLLHEAGHLAVAPSEIRNTLSGEVVLPGVDMDAVESKAIAWSFAAAVHLELNPALLFHEGGYKGRSQSLLMSFSLGVYPGLNGLEEDGMTVGPGRAAEQGVPPYPIMIKWLKD